MVQCSDPVWVNVKCSELNNPNRWKRLTVKLFKGFLGVTSAGQVASLGLRQKARNPAALDCTARNLAIAYLVLHSALSRLGPGGMATRYSEVNPQKLPSILHRIKNASCMDSVGLFLNNADGRFSQGMIIGLPEDFEHLYRSIGQPIDPVLAYVRRTGRPASTQTHLGSRWTTSQLYNKVSRKFGLDGFAALPIYDGQDMHGILYFGTERVETTAQLNTDGLLDLSVFATQVSTEIAQLPRQLPHLTPRQRDVAELASAGLSNAEIANELSTGESAVRKHLKALNRVFGTDNRTAMSAAYRSSL